MASVTCLPFMGLGFRIMLCESFFLLPASITRWMWGLREGLVIGSAEGTSGMRVEGQEMEKESGGFLGLAIRWRESGVSWNLHLAI